MQNDRLAPHIKRGGTMQHFSSMLSLGAFDWKYFNNSIFSQTIIKGAMLTIVLAVLAQVTGTLIGLVLYLLRRAKNPIPRALADFYVWLFRGTPLLVQIFLLFYLIPFFHLVPTIRANDFFLNTGFSDTYMLEAFLAGFIAFSLNEGAYMSEIVRAGINAVDVGQMEAAKSLGMSYGLAMRRIILPQAARVIIPPLGNEFNSMLKTTSLAYGIGLADLFGAANDRASSTSHYLEFFLVASVWYLAMTTLWGLVQSWIERRLNASSNDAPPTATFIDRLLGRNLSPTAIKESANEALLSGGRR